MSRVTKLFVFPVNGKIWAYQAKPPLIPSEAGEIPSVRALFAKLGEKKTVSERSELVAEYAAHQMHGQWSKLGDSKEGSIWKRIHNIGQRLLSQIKPSETVLKNVPKQSDSIEILFPEGINPKLVRRRVRLLAKSGIEFHKRCFYGSAILLPFTSLLGILPTPNFPFFWNIYRTHAHWTALRGSTRLLELTTVPKLITIEKNTLSKLEGGHPKDGSQMDENSDSQELVLTQSPSLKEALMFDKSGAIPESILANVCSKFDLDFELMKRWVKTK